MKSIMFRPLRRVKKTGKIVVAAYSQWRKIVTADYAAFCLTVDNEYAGLPVDEHVYNHEGEPLFWHNFNPADIPIFVHDGTLNFKEIQAQHIGYAIRWMHNYNRTNYSCSKLRMDCDGVPCFSHTTIDFVAEHVSNFADYEPLTVGMVVKWFGWFLYQLENSNLQIGRP